MLLCCHAREGIYVNYMYNLAEDYTHYALAQLSAYQTQLGNAYGSITYTCSLQVIDPSGR